MLVHIILSPNRILIFDFSLCNVNCAVTSLQEKESTDGGGGGACENAKNSWWMKKRNKIPSMN